MNNFSQIFQCMPIGSASSSSGHFGGTFPCKVQIYCDIPIFEGKIEANALDKWLNVLEGYFLVQKFSK